MKKTPLYLLALMLLSINALADSEGSGLTIPFSHTPYATETSVSTQASKEGVGSIVEDGAPMGEPSSVVSDFRSVFPTPEAAAEHCNQVIDLIAGTYDVFAGAWSFRCVKMEQVYGNHGRG